MNKVDQSQKVNSVSDTAITEEPNTTQSHSNEHCQIEKQETVEQSSNIQQKISADKNFLVQRNDQLNQGIGIQPFEMNQYMFAGYIPQGHQSARFQPVQIDSQTGLYTQEFNSQPYVQQFSQMNPVYSFNSDEIKNQPNVQQIINIGSQRNQQTPNQYSISIQQPNHDENSRSFHDAGLNNDFSGISRVQNAQPFPGLVLQNPLQMQISASSSTPTYNIRPQTLPPLYTGMTLNKDSHPVNAGIQFTNVSIPSLKQSNSSPCPSTSVRPFILPQRLMSPAQTPQQQNILTQRSPTLIQIPQTCNPVSSQFSPSSLSSNQQRMQLANSASYATCNIQPEQPQVAFNAGVRQFQDFSLTDKIAFVTTQMSQIQANLNALASNPSPQAKELSSQLAARLQYLVKVYISLSQQLQTQRQLLAQNPGLAPQLLPNSNAGLIQQPQMILQSQLNPNYIPQLVATPSSVSRPGIQLGGFQIRPNNQVPIQAMMNTSLVRLNQPRPMFNSNTYPMGGQKVLRPSGLDLSRNRRNKERVLGKRRRKYSTESDEEEEDITSSDGEAVSSFGPDSIPIEDMELRRSTRKHKPKSYNFDDDELSDTDDKDKTSNTGIPGSLGGQDLVAFQPAEQGEGRTAIIEKVLADRKRPVTEDDSEQDENGEVDEFFVKYKYFSYLHCDWGTLSELKLKDKNAGYKIKRYKLKKNDSPFMYIDDEPYNPDYVEVDRILDVRQTSESSNPNIMLNYYLVKWCSLPYDESTWEFEDDLDSIKIQEYRNRQKIQPPEQMIQKPRPSPSQWRRIPESPIYKNENTLRDYQLEGINWLLYCYYNWASCILADEMGLGKTIQSITFLVELKRSGFVGPFLVIAPLSTIANWYREFENWSDFNVVVLHGSAASRGAIHRYELYYRNDDGEIISNYFKFEVIVTTYEMVSFENKFLSSVSWRIAIVDEAHRLKNRNCKLLENLSNINIEHRVLLTGTPLQNSVDELFSLLNFLDPQRMPSVEMFMNEFGKLETGTQVQRLQQVLKPIMLRRLKEDVEKNIAAKEETIIEVEMTSIQKKVYFGILERNLSFLMKGTTSANMPNLMNAMMELRKCCNHPFLINGVEDRIVAEYFTANPLLNHTTVHNKALVESSGKLVLVDKLLPKLRESGHKVLIFSQMVRVLDILEEYLIANKFTFERIDGSVRGNLRQAAIDRFSKPDSDRFAFLLCTKAGGLGINLTAADTVIIFDSDWNPQNDIQAQARCHRIGQNKAVKVYRLICRNSYEREMFDRASMKLGLDKAVLQNINNSHSDGKIGDNSRTQLSKKDIEALLKRGAYAAVMDEDTDASARFCSEDIEQILERRATVVQIVGEGKGSTFAKASFNAESSAREIDIDDPDFWEKWAESARIGPKNDVDLYDDKPRIRKQVKRLDDDPDVEFSSLGSDGELVSPKSVVRRTSWLRSECFKVEKNLLVFGWGRWSDIYSNSNFKTHMCVYDIEQISKTILVYCWHHCKLDSSFAEFVEKVIRLSIYRNRHGDLEGEDYNYKPYGKRRGKATRNKPVTRRKIEGLRPCLLQVGSDWRNIDCEMLVLDSNYRKHLQHYSSKIMIRLRLLFIIEYEMLRNFREAILSGLYIDDIDLSLSSSSSLGPPLTTWWNSSCDKSLIIGTNKHGYEKYTEMKADSQLCFIGHFDNGDIKVEIEQTDQVVKRRGRRKKVVQKPASDDEEKSDNSIHDDLEVTIEVDTSSCTQSISESCKGSEWPTPTDCNTRLRRLVMAYWKQKQNISSKSKGNGEISDKPKLTKKEESEFYRGVINFGFERDSDNKFIWSNFRRIYSFEKRTDEKLSEYANQLLKNSSDVMANKGLGDDNKMTMEHEKAVNVITSVELFNDIRKIASDFNLMGLLSGVALFTVGPSWWVSPMHDVDLIRGVARYGIEQRDSSLFSDNSLLFKNIYDEIFERLKPQLSETVLKDLVTSFETIKREMGWPSPSVIINRCRYLCDIALENMLNRDKQKTIPEIIITYDNNLSSQVNLNSITDEYQKIDEIAIFRGDSAVALSGNELRGISNESNYPPV